MKASLKHIALLLALTVTSCVGAKDVNRSAAGSNGPTNAASAKSSTSRLCSLFTAAEIKDVLGAAVGEGKVGGPLDSACQWDGDNDVDPPVYAQVQLINDTQYWEKHSGAKGYEVLHGIGKEAFVASTLGGWEAGTVNDRAVVFVTVSGGSASRDTAVNFLHTALKRLQMK